MSLSLSLSLGNNVFEKLKLNHFMTAQVYTFNSYLPNIDTRVSFLKTNEKALKGDENTARWL